MKYSCSKCGKKLELKKIKVKTRVIGGGIEEAYYNCYKCNAKHIICITNEEARELKRKIDSLKKVIRSKHEQGLKYIPESLEVEKLLKQYKSKLDKLNNKAS